MINLINLKEKPTPDYDLYIGRENKWYQLKGSKWHNPIYLEKESDREIVIFKYFKYIIKQKDLLSQLEELDNKILACWCTDSEKPDKMCHGLVLIILRELQKKAELSDFIEKYNDIPENDKFKYILGIIKNENIKP